MTRVTFKREIKDNVNHPTQRVNYIIMCSADRNAFFQQTLIINLELSSHSHTEL